MCDQDHFEEDRLEYEARGMVTRREFGVLLGAGMMMLPAGRRTRTPSTETEVTVKTPDGTADATSCTRQRGTGAGVLLWPDIFGLRPAIRQMGKRLAESGYSVLVVNPFYRAKKAPTAENGAATPDPGADPAHAGAERKDAHDRRKGVHRLAGPAAVGGQEPEDRYAGLLHGRPDRLPHLRGGARSRRRRGLVPRRRPGRPTSPNSPHVQAAATKAQFLVAIAENDDKHTPTEKDVLRETLAKASLPAEIEVYPARAHGWCPPDSQVYNEPQAERAWSRLLALYGKALA